MALDESSVVLRHQIKFGNIMSLKKITGGICQLTSHGSGNSQPAGSICGRPGSAYSRRSDSKDWPGQSRTQSDVGRPYSMPPLSPLSHFHQSWPAITPKCGLRARQRQKVPPLFSSPTKSHLYYAISAYYSRS